MPFEEDEHARQWKDTPYVKQVEQYQYYGVVQYYVKHSIGNYNAGLGSGILVVIHHGIKYHTARRGDRAKLRHSR